MHWDFQLQNWERERPRAVYLDYCISRSLGGGIVWPQMNFDGVLATYSRVKPHVPAAERLVTSISLGSIWAYPPQHPQKGSRLLTANPNIYAGNEARRHKYFMPRHFSNSARTRVKNIPERKGERNCERRNGKRERERERNIQWNTILDRSSVFVSFEELPSQNRWSSDL